jgi:hypothetical protein
MNVQRHFRRIGLLLLVLVAFYAAHVQEPPVNGFDDYVNKFPKP